MNILVTFQTFSLSVKSNFELYVTETDHEISFINIIFSTVSFSVKILFQKVF